MSHMQEREPEAEEAGKNSQRLNAISAWYLNYWIEVNLNLVEFAVLFASSKSQ